jgi:hypothetical protein
MPDLLEPTPPPERDPPHGLLARLGWFVAIAFVSAFSAVLAAYALKALLPTP